jgi:hypothetical protein
MVGINNLKKDAVMKKILAFLILSVAIVSCYDDYVKDFDYDSVYFPIQNDVRSFVVGEGMSIEIGVSLGGVMDNAKERTVGFKIDNPLITPAVLTAMKNSSLTYIKAGVANVTTLGPIPTSYYSLSDNSKMVIKVGQHMGTIVMKADSANFLADAGTIDAKYAISMSITSADADTILPKKNYTIVGLRYENMLFGNYFHGGTALVNRPGKSDTTLNYFTTIPQPETKIWILTTATPGSLTANGYLNVTTTKKEMTLTLNGTNVTISSAAGSTNTILPDGASTFNRSKLLQNRKIFLKYSYVSGGNTYHCNDTLTFRNRIRDGVNEWQDENPANYLK